MRAAVATLSDLLSERDQYLVVVSALLYRLSGARDLIDVNIAAGIALEEIDAVGQETGKPPGHVLKPV